MQTKWILILAIAVIAGIVGSVLILAPGITPTGIVQQGQATAGDTFMLVNQSGIALTFYNEALATSPNDPALLQKKAEALLASGQTGEAEQIYRQLLSSNPHDPAILVRMGDFSSMNGDYTGAIGYYDAALALQPKNAGFLLRDGDANLMLAATQFREQHAAFLDTLDAYRTAIDEYAQAEKLDPRLAAVVSARTLAADHYEASGDYQSLVAALQASP